MKYIWLYVFVLCFTISAFPQHSTPLNENLPDNFPFVDVLTRDNPAQGYIFAAPLGEWGQYTGTDPYLVVYDNYGTPVFFQEQTMRSFDFKLQPNGILTYFGGTPGYPHHALNDKFEHIRHYCPIEVVDDFHEMIFCEDGSYFMLGLENRIVDMDTVVEGGHKGVIVCGNVVQYFNENNSLLFNWNSWDHFSIFDGNDYMVDLTDSIQIDLVHANSIERDTDSTILLSCRNMDEITKISLLTGDIIWRMGGKNNMFEFEHDTCKFHMQHDVRKLENDLISVHDNSTPDFMDKSRAVIYQVDEENMTVNVSKVVPQSYPGYVHGLIMGNSQVMQNGSVFIGWGSGEPNIMEFHPDGSEALVFDYNTVSYRAFKFDWKPQAITFNLPQADFGKVNVEDSVLLKLIISNNREEDIEINYLHHQSDYFQLKTAIPLIIFSNDSVEVELEFTPDGEGEYEDLLTFCWDTAIDGLNQRIGGQIIAKAVAETGIGIVDETFIKIKVYPVPVSTQLNIDYGNFTGDIHKLVLTNSLGQVMINKQLLYQKHNSISTSDLPAGIYQLFLFTDQGVDQRTIVKY